MGDFQLKLTKIERDELTELSRGSALQHRLVQRAKIILKAADGWDVSAIARALDTTRPTVRKWRDRYAAMRDRSALDDLERSGRPSRVSVAERCELVKLACTRPDPRYVSFRETWTHGALREEYRRSTGVSLSLTEVGRILRSEGLRPHRVRLWLHSPDPQFRAKARRVCALYVSPPAGATVLCVDEKTCIQALSHRHPLQPARPGRDGRREFEYRRHGVRALIGAFDIRTGQVFAHVRERRTAADLDAFMEDVAKRYPTGDVYIVWDNLNIHCGPAWERFSARHGGRFHFVHTPIHASWLNQIEVWFGILQRRVLRHGDFADLNALSRALRGFVHHWNRREAHPFRWTFRGRFDQHRRRAAA